jgi:hypothetical protein
MVGRCKGVSDMHRRVEMEMCVSFDDGGSLSSDKQKNQNKESEREGLFYVSFAFW